jgi:hypothetical protein
MTGTIGASNPQARDRIASITAGSEVRPENPLKEIPVRTRWDSAGQKGLASLQRSGQAQARSKIAEARSRRYPRRPQVQSLDR